MRLLALVLMMLWLSGCTFGVPIGGQSSSGQKLSQGKSKYGNPSSYVVFGKRYYVMDSADGYVERGIASWYGPDFHGKRTSSGEDYNMHAMTAAHKSLPLPTKVKVKNLSNGKWVILTVNDRGPFKDNRIIDLSFAAAKKLDVVGPGTAKVEVTALTASGKKTAKVRALPLKNTTRDDSDLYIQLGSFGSELNAKNLSNELLAKNEKPIMISKADTEKGIFYRVRLGPLLDIGEADSVYKRLINKGYKAARIVIGEN